MKALYENTAHKYDIRHENSTTQYLRKNERKEIKKAKGLVLDIGCGTGEYAIFENYIGIDISKNMIKEALKKHRKDFIISDSATLPFKSCSFDTLICMFTVLNLCQIPLTIKEMSRVLKKDGKLIISVASIWDKKNYSIKDKILNKYSGNTKNIRIEKNRMTFKLFTKNELLDIFKKYGFLNESFSGIYKWQMPYWNKYRDFTKIEKIKLIMERILPSSYGRIYIATFRKA